MSAHEVRLYRSLSESLGRTQAFLISMPIPQECTIGLHLG